MPSNYSSQKLLPRAPRARALFQQWEDRRGGGRSRLGDSQRQ